MKKILLSVLILFLFSAATSKAADTNKIGFVDLQRAIVESEAGKKARVDLEAFGKSKQGTIDEKLANINKLEDELAKQASVLSAAARKSKEEELEKLQRDFQRLVADSRAELQKKENELTSAILKDMIELIEEVGESEGYTIILSSEFIIYHKKEIDITDSIIKKFNESSGKAKKETKEKPKEKK